jgi:hypothetical protein
MADMYMLSLVLCVVQVLTLICLYLILDVTRVHAKRSFDLLEQILLLQRKASKKADSVGPTSPLNKQPLAPKVANLTYNFSTDKWETTYNETDKK